MEQNDLFPEEKGKQNNTKTKKAKTDLTPQQDLFAFYVAYTFNYAESYRKAYKVSLDTKPNTIYTSVNQLKKNPKITLRIKYYRRTVFAQKVLEAEDVLKNLSEIALKYRSDDKYLISSLRALEKMGEYHGLFKNKDTADLSGVVVNLNTSFITKESAGVADGLAVQADARNERVKQQTGEDSRLRRTPITGKEVQQVSEDIKGEKDE